jgi:tetratricopeptide (TPR) repeat protein
LRKLILLLSGTLLFLVSCHPKPQAKKTASTAAFDKAYNLLTINQDSAFYYFNKLVSESRDSQQVALAYTNMAMIQSDAGDYYGAQESLISSVQFLGEMNKDRQPYQAQNYNELAITAIKLKNYKEAISYCGQALALTSDSSFGTTILNNQANAYRYLKDYRPAMERYRQAINLTDHRGKSFARVLTNYTITRWLDNPKYNPVPELLGALEIRVREKDSWGQNSSYAHLADFYTEKLPDSALYYANKRYEIAKQLKSPDDELEALQKLIALAPMGKVRPYFTRFTALNDSLQTARNAAKNQFALIRYDAEKNKADNLRLQKLNGEKEYQLAGILLLILFGSVGAIFVYRKRQERLRLEHEQKIRQSELKLSQRVHDVVANGIYRVMNEVEYNEQLDRDHLLDQLENMYERSRDISYFREDAASEDFTEKISALLSSFKSPSIKLAVSGNDPALWLGIPQQIKYELEPILQELMVNMTKHSGANQAILTFERKTGDLHLAYRDNGKGFDDHLTMGNGLQNTVSRISSLGGSLTFGPQAKKGAQMQIAIPLN